MIVGRTVSIRLPVVNDRSTGTIGLPAVSLRPAMTTVCKVKSCINAAGTNSNPVLPEVSCRLPGMGVVLPSGSTCNTVDLIDLGNSGSSNKTAMLLFSGISVASSAGSIETSEGGVMSGFSGSVSLSTSVLSSIPSPSESVSLGFVPRRISSPSLSPSSSESGSCGSVFQVSTSSSSPRPSPSASG